MRGTVLLFGIVTGCASSTATRVPAGAQLLYTPADTMQHPQWAYGGSYGYEDTHREVVRDSAAWVAVWNTVHPGPGPALPAVDFTKVALVVVSAGTFSAAGPRIAIDSILASDRRLYVVVRSALCPSGIWGGGAMVVSPMDIVLIPASYKQVRFVEAQTTFFGCHPAAAEATN